MTNPVEVLRYPIIEPFKLRRVVVKPPGFGAGSVWAADYFDRYMRDDTHYQTTKLYIEMNPVTAGLCLTPEAWPFSSAGWK